jgi:uncharacterized pyridoxamine 5'-phosphate oxidase family protein
MQEVINFLKKAETYYLATVDGNKPHVRPFGTAHVFEGKIYILTSKSKPCSQQIIANPNVEICAMIETSWLRIEAKAITDDRVVAKQSMLDAYPNLKEMYSAEDDNTHVLYLKDATATFASFSDPPKVVKF